MKCARIEKILIEGMHEQSSTVQVQLQEHLEHCSRCRKFSEELQILRAKTAMLAATVSPEVLAGSVLNKCRALFPVAVQSSAPQVPAWVWACVGLLCLLTVIWAYPVMKDLVTEDSITHSTGLVIKLMIQNAIMLLFAPLIIRIFRHRAQKSPYRFMHTFRRN